MCEVKLTPEALLMQLVRRWQYLFDGCPEALRRLFDQQSMPLIGFVLPDLRLAARNICSGDNSLEPFRCPYRGQRPHGLFATGGGCEGLGNSQALQKREKLFSSRLESEMTCPYQRVACRRRVSDVLLRRKIQ